MSAPIIKYCPGTLSEGFDTYSRACLNRVFGGKKVNHILPYNSPVFGNDVDDIFEDNRKRISISGVQEKFMVVMDKNKLRLSHKGEPSTFILKPIPAVGKRKDQMPANEHVTMQIAYQVYDIETADNAIIFFADGEMAYITKRFDVNADGSKRAQEDFASLAGLTPHTHGANYKYSGHYLDFFILMKKYFPAYKVEAVKLLKLLIFNYLFSNGDAHFKNFSLVETTDGDFKLSPAYDLLNTRIHIDDADFALTNGLLPPAMNKGSIKKKFGTLCDESGIDRKILDRIWNEMISRSDKVERLVFASYMNDATKKNYLHLYHAKLKQMLK